jgi:uncharacterized membrane protein YhhN
VPPRPRNEPPPRADPLTSAAAFILGGAGIIALADWWAVAAERRPVELATKPLVVSLLILATVVLTPEAGDQRLLFAAALGLSLAGDVALVAPPRWFGAGLAFFLGAHLLYVVGLLSEPGASESPLLAVLIVTIGGLLVGIPIVAGAARRRGRWLAMAVVAYLATISATLVAADASGDAVARIGVLALYASDAVLGWNRFVRPIPHGRFLTRVPYHAGQALMALSLIA